MPIEYTNVSENYNDVVYKRMSITMKDENPISFSASGTGMLFNQDPPRIGIPRMSCFNIVSFHKYRSNLTNFKIGNIDDNYFSHNLQRYYENGNIFIIITKINQENRIYIHSNMSDMDFHNYIKNIYYSLGNRIENEDEPIDYTKITNINKDEFRDIFEYFKSNKM